MKRLGFWLVLIGAGAALAYYLDPANGAHRRRSLRRTPLGAALPNEQDVDDPPRYDAGITNPTTHVPADQPAPPVEPVVQGVRS